MPVMRILVAEDDCASRLLMQLCLSKLGQCTLVPTGQKAIATIKEAIEKNEYFDLICLDIMMPEADGLEVLQTIRLLENEHAASGIKPAKVIMATAKGQKNDTDAAFAIGCDAYIIKPVDKVTLLSKISKLGLLGN